MLSVFYNSYNVNGLNIDGLVCNVKATSKDNIIKTYSQADMARFLIAPRPRTTIHPPQPTVTTSWKRVFEEGLQLLEDEYTKKKTRLNQLDNRIKEMMEERQSVLVEMEDFEKKKRLAKNIIF